MTPQLQHAIKLLQMSTLDLRQEIQENLENNPLLEIEENLVQDEKSEQPGENNQHQENAIDLSLQSHQSLGDTKEAIVEDNQITEKLENPLSDELPLDATWEDTYQSSQLSSKEKNENLSAQEYITNNSTEETLQDYLIWQLNLVPLAREDKILWLTLVDSIDSNGFLTADLEEILEAVNIEESGYETTIEI